MRSAPSMPLKHHSFATVKGARWMISKEFLDAIYFQLEQKMVGPNLRKICF